MLFPLIRAIFFLINEGPVAQRLEQRTHNPLVLGSNPSGPTNVFRSSVFQSADLSVFRGAILIEKTAQDSRQGLPWKAAIHGCAFQSPKKLHCTARAQTAEVGVHQLPPAAHRSARYRCWFPVA